MTGFAREETAAEWGMLSWELRAVNHRYLDIQLRLPEDLRVCEPDFRKAVAEVVSRGKVDASLRFEKSADTLSKPIINERLLVGLIRTAAEISKRMHRPAPLSPIDLMRWPRVIEEPEAQLDPVRQGAIDLLRVALGRLDEMRTREGTHLREMLLQRCTQLNELVEGIRQRLPEIHTRARQRVDERLAELGVEPDANRLEQEFVLLAQKMDVAEELDRLDGHLEEVSAVVDHSGPVGRRLDFLMQELNREANTLSSKSQDLATTRAAVDMKVLIEQMREQSQNIE